MWILWKMRLWKCNFVKNYAVEMWILWKMRLWKCEFLDKLRNFAPVWANKYSWTVPVDLAKHKPNWIQTFVDRPIADSSNRRPCTGPTCLGHEVYSLIGHAKQRSGYFCNSLQSPFWLTGQLGTWVASYHPFENCIRPILWNCPCRYVMGIEMLWLLDLSCEVWSTEIYWVLDDVSFVAAKMIHKSSWCNPHL